MRVRPRRRPPTAVAIGVIALGFALGVVGAAYGAQRLLLRTPPQGELLAAKSVAELPRFRYARSTIHVAGQPVRHAECLEGWQVLLGSKRRVVGRGAEAIFDDGERLRVGARKVIVVTPGRHPTGLPPIAELELAGCGHLLANYVYGRLFDDRRVRAIPVVRGGRPAYKLHIRTRRTHFDVFVDRDTLRTFAVRLETKNRTAFSKVRQVRLTPARKQSFIARFSGG